VKVIDETIFPTGSMDNHPTIKAIIEDSQITPEQLNEIGSSVASVKVSAIQTWGKYSILSIRSILMT
jgi:hypothetical protein